MCLICATFNEDKLTVLEGWRNFNEIKKHITPEHEKEVFDMLLDATEKISRSYGSKLTKPTIESVRVKNV